MSQQGCQPLATDSGRIWDLRLHGRDQVSKRGSIYGCLLDAGRDSSNIGLGQPQERMVSLDIHSRAIDVTSPHTNRGQAIGRAGRITCPA
jgi:hypothetical protein